MSGVLTLDQGSGPWVSSPNSLDGLVHEFYVIGMRPVQELPDVADVREGRLGEPRQRDVYPKGRSVSSRVARMRSRMNSG